MDDQGYASPTDVRVWSQTPDQSIMLELVRQNEMIKQTAEMAAAFAPELAKIAETVERIQASIAELCVRFEEEGWWRRP